MTLASAEVPTIVPLYERRAATQHSCAGCALVNQMRAVDGPPVKPSDGSPGAVQNAHGTSIAVPTFVPDGAVRTSPLAPVLQPVVDVAPGESQSLPGPGGETGPTTA